MGSGRDLHDRESMLTPLPFRIFFKQYQVKYNPDVAEHLFIWIFNSKMSLLRRPQIHTRLFWRHDVHDFTRSVQSHTSRCSNLKCSGKPYYYFIGIVRSKGNASTDAQKCVFKALKERLSRARSMYFSYM